MELLIGVYLFFTVCAFIAHTTDWKSWRDVLSSVFAAPFWPFTVVISILRKL